jgi:hypothetical protein
VNEVPLAPLGGWPLLLVLVALVVIAVVALRRYHEATGELIQLGKPGHRALELEPAAPPWPSTMRLLDDDPVELYDWRSSSPELV